MRLRAIMIKKLVVTLTLFILLGVSSNSQAGLIYSVEFTPTTPTTGFSGTGWNADVFLREQFLPGDNPILDSATGIGVNSIGAHVNLTGPAGGVFTGATGNTSFGNQYLFFGGLPAHRFADSVSSNLFGFPPPVTGSLAGGDWTIKIGSFSGTFGAAGLSDTLSFDSSTTSAFFDGNDVPFTPTLGGSVTFSAIAVPEPSSIALVGLAGAGFVGRVALRRRNKNKK